jgi:hypothetical protein
MPLRKQTLVALILFQDFHFASICSTTGSPIPLEYHFLMASENLATLKRPALVMALLRISPMPYRVHF